MLSNAYFLAKFRFDTAENEPAKKFQNFRKMHFRKMHFQKMHVGADPASHAPRRLAVLPGDFSAMVPILAFFENAFFENAFFENFANFWRARSRLYQNEILQENMRF